MSSRRNREAWNDFEVVTRKDGANIEEIPNAVQVADEIMSILEMPSTPESSASSDDS